MTVVSSLNESLPSIRHVLLVNTFIALDESHKTFLHEFQRELSSGKLDDFEFPFYFYKYISETTKPGDAGGASPSKFLENPISIYGRLVLIAGVLKSAPLERRIKKIYLPMYIVHSLTNCLIEMSHVDKIEQVESESYKDVSQPEANLKRKVIYVEGGHNLFKDNPSRLLDLLNKFTLKR